MGAGEKSSAPISMVLFEIIVNEKEATDSGE
jgi:hypothetical protein